MGMAEVQLEYQPGDEVMLGDRPGLVVEVQDFTVLVHFDKNERRMAYTRRVTPSELRLLARANRRSRREAAQYAQREAS